LDAVLVPADDISGITRPL